MSAVAILSAPTPPAAASRGGESVDAGAFGALVAEARGDGGSAAAPGPDGKAVADDLAQPQTLTPPSGGVVIALPLPLVVPEPVIAPAPEDTLLDETTEVSSFQPDVTTAVPSAPTPVIAQTSPSAATETPTPQTRPSAVTPDAPAQDPGEPAPVTVQDTADADQADAKAAVATASRPATDAALLASTNLVPPPQGDTVRTRDVIDRASQRTTTTEASTTGEAATPGGETHDHPTDAVQAKATPDARPATTAQPPTAEIVAATQNAPAEAGPEPVVQGGSSTQTAETHGITAQDLTLSSLARATIETTAQLAAQITRRLEGRYTRFELALTPEGLGRVDVSLDIDSEGQLAARLAFDNPAAATDLRGRADELRRQLEDAGFRIAHDGLDFAERDPSSGGGFDRRQGHDGGRAFAGASRLAAQADAAPPQWINLNLTPRGVDMKV